MDVDFHYTTASPEAYETLLRDVIVGDQTLFMRRDTVEDGVALGAADPRCCGKIPTASPFPYAAGSWGPTERVAD